ncbi:hypothetical protein [Rickettsiella endosymbiont of Dermanyssus gallinae]|uniref:hypothetical protein n=1 Tax=Rickettsiella endosymbiont of Dermanyssus gallinae TaxID=2856608 RepID=UPI001C527ED9|nr:hypothetical protein [Rickettsiella endosymbiont of Dermanyssus gallinae]
MISVFLFYNRGIGKYNLFSFSQELVHSALLCYQGDHCILFEIAPAGFIYRILKSKDVNRNLESIKKLPMLTAFIVTFIKEPKKVKEFPIKWYTCNEVCRYFSGIDIGWTFNPRHLYRKLLKYKDKSNYELLAHWRRA